MYTTYCAYPQEWGAAEKAGDGFNPKRVCRLSFLFYFLISIFHFLVRQARTEVGGGEVVEGAEAGGEFGGGQAALAVEAADKIVGGLFSFLREAFYSSRNQVAVGIAPQPRPRHDVVQALDCRRGVTQAVEALVALARGDGLSQRHAPRKLPLLEVRRRAGAHFFFLGGGPAFDAIQPHGANLFGQPHLHYVPQFAALHQAQTALRDAPPHSCPPRSSG